MNSQPVSTTAENISGYLAFFSIKFMEIGLHFLTCHGSGAFPDREHRAVAHIEGRNLLVGSLSQLKKNGVEPVAQFRVRCQREGERVSGDDILCVKEAGGERVGAGTEKLSGNLPSSAWLGRSQFRRWPGL